MALKVRPVNPTLEDLCMAFRYAYYVEANPIISDHDYDVLERLAHRCLKGSSPMQRCGSDSASSYSDEQKNLAFLLRQRIEGGS